VVENFASRTTNGRLGKDLLIGADNPIDFENARQIVVAKSPKWRTLPNASGSNLRRKDARTPSDGH
jgi:hypothetical protein